MCCIHVCIRFAEMKRSDILRSDKIFGTSCIKIDTAVKQRRLIGRQPEETKRGIAELIYRVQSR